MEEKLVKHSFDGFDVYQIEEGHSFIYANFNDEEKFINGLVDYLFLEDNLLNHACRVSKIAFTGKPKQYVKLYKNISIFLNSELESLELNNVTEDIMKTIEDEYCVNTSNGKVKIQPDKIGKIGEYAFHIILTKYFELDCIIPKFRCVSDRNMSVFGIDALFFCADKKTIYLGESKFSKTIENGIKLANQSLQNYEEQIREEYKLVLSSDVYKLSDEFLRIYEKYTQISISFEKFIDEAKISDICVPIFVAHGKTGVNDSPEYYIQNMRKKIKQQAFLGLNTKYLFISLPVISKSKFIEIAIRKIKEKQNEYERKCS